MIDDEIGEQPRLESVHSRHRAGEAVPPAFRYRHEAAETLKTIPAEQLNGARYIQLVAGKLVSRPADIDDDATCQAELGICLETTDQGLEIVRLKVEIGIQETQILVIAAPQSVDACLRVLNDGRETSPGPRRQREQAHPTMRPGRRRDDLVRPVG